MSVTIAELDQFHEFAREKLKSHGALSMQDLVALWEAQQSGPDELSESLSALEAGLADAAAGRVRPAKDVFRDLAARYRTSSSSCES